MFTSRFQWMFVLECRQLRYQSRRLRWRQHYGTYLSFSWTISWNPLDSDDYDDANRSTIWKSTCRYLLGFSLDLAGRFLFINSDSRVIDGWFHLGLGNLGVDLSICLSVCRLIRARCPSPIPTVEFPIRSVCNHDWTDCLIDSFVIDRSEPESTCCGKRSRIW